MVGKGVGARCVPRATFLPYIYNIFAVCLYEEFDFLAHTPNRRRPHMNMHMRLGANRRPCYTSQDHNMLILTSISYRAHVIPCPGGPTSRVVRSPPPRSNLPRTPLPRCTLASLCIPALLVHKKTKEGRERIPLLPAVLFYMTTKR